MNLMPFMSFENVEMGPIKVSHRPEDIFEAGSLEEEGHFGTYKAGPSLPSLLHCLAHNQS